MRRTRQTSPSLSGPNVLWFRQCVNVRNLFREIVIVGDRDSVQCQPIQVLEIHRLLQNYLWPLTISSSRSGLMMMVFERDSSCSLAMREIVELATPKFVAIETKLSSG